MRIKIITHTSMKLNTYIIFKRKYENEYYNIDLTHLSFIKVHSYAHFSIYDIQRRHT